MAMTKRSEMLTPVTLQEAEAEPGRPLHLKATTGTLYSITKPNKQPLPRGMLAVQEEGKVILKYPDGTEVVVSLD